MRAFSLAFRKARIAALEKTESIIKSTRIKDYDLSVDRRSGKIVLSPKKISSK